MDGILFLAATPTEPSDTSRVQIAKTGSFVDPRYGKFKITREHFSKWIGNFQTLDSPEKGRMGLPVDVDHSPEKQGTTEAAGWVKSLDTLGADGKSASPNELWATVEWNTLGQELIRDKRYAYLSPSYQFDYKDEEGHAHGTALVGVGMTNRPFLSMATVSLCAAFATLDEDPLPGEPERPDQSGSSTRPSQFADTPGVMTDFTKNLAKALNLAEDSSEESLLSAVQSASAQPEPDKDSIDLSKVAEDQGKVLLSKDQLTALSEDAAAGREASKQLHLSKFTAAFEAAVSKGQATPAQKDTMQELYLLDDAKVLKLLDEAPAAVPVQPKGSTGAVLASDNEFEGYQVDEDAKLLHDRTMAISLGRKLGYADALVLAEQGHKE
jgi:phage I-like protein